MKWKLVKMERQVNEASGNTWPHFKLQHSKSTQKLLPHYLVDEAVWRSKGVFSTSQHLKNHINVNWVTKSPDDLSEFLSLEKVPMHRMEFSSHQFGLKHLSYISCLIHISPIILCCHHCPNKKTSIDHHHFLAGLCWVFFYAGLAGEWT